jgi:hypothetical protein
MAINLTTKYSPLIDERFKASSFTEKFAGKKYTFDGAQSIKIYSVDKVALNDYDRTAVTGDRFGTPVELGDTIQTMTMSKDKSFTFLIDAGNSADQLNIKHCNEQLKSQWDEVCTPDIDIYRFNKWANGAGLGTIGSALTTGTALTAIATANAAMSNKLVPKKNRTLFITESSFVKCKLATEVVGIDSIGAKAVTNGSVGKLDGCDVVPVPDSYFPTGVVFILKYKDSTVDPMKLKTLRVHKNPPGYDADKGECRYYHDSFVLGNKVNGIYVYATAGVLAAPTLTNTSNTVTFACTNSTGIKYTLDGTDPKTSATAETVLAAAYTSGAVTLTAGQTMRAYAYATSGYVNSPISETSYSA